MNVSAVLVTRGNFDMQPVIDSLPKSWEIVIWDNGEHRITRSDGWAEVCQDLSVYGRYAAIEDCTHDLIYVQDDDVIVSDPQGIVEEWMANGETPGAPDGKGNGHLVANMPQEFRHDGYTDSALVGFGAAFHRDAPRHAFQRWWQRTADNAIGGVCMPVWGFESPTFINSLGYLATPWRDQFFQRTCDVVFTTITPRVLVDVPKVNREFAEDQDRMYRQTEHFGERTRMLELARQARDA